MSRKTKKKNNPWKDIAPVSYLVVNEKGKLVKRKLKNGITSSKFIPQLIIGSLLTIKHL